MQQTYASIGHGRTSSGGHDTGTMSNGASEHALAREVVAYAAKRLKARGAKFVHETCPDGPHSHAPNWVGSVARVNDLEGSSGLLCAVEFHFDWYRAPRGGFGLHDGSREGIALSKAIEARYKQAGLPTRRHSNRSGLGFIRRATTTAILWECDRIDNYSPSHLRLVGEAIADGIADHLDIAQSPPQGGTVPRPGNLPMLFRIRNQDAVFARKPGAAVKHVNRAWLLLRHGPNWQDRVVSMEGATLFRYSTQGHTYAVVRYKGEGWLVGVSNAKTAFYLGGEDWTDHREDLDRLPL